MVRTLFADINQAGHIRGYCAFDEDPAKRPLLDDLSAATGPVRLGPVMGDGYIAFTVDDVDTGGRYQGIVELDRQGLDAAAVRWFKNSEQLDTVVIVAAGEQSGGWQATADGQCHSSGRRRGRDTAYGQRDGSVLRESR